MKYNLFLASILIMPVHIMAASEISSAKLTRSRRIISAPIEFEIKNEFETNIDRLANPLYENINTQSFKIHTKFKHKPIKRSVLINIPSVKFKYAGQMEQKIRNLNVQNTIIGVYLPSRGRVYSLSATTNYTNAITTNEDSRLENNQYFNLTSDASISQKFNTSHNLSIGP